MRVNATFVHPRGRNANAIIGTMSTTNQVVLPKIAQERMKRLETRTAKIGVIGLGYVGLPLSLLLSEAGFKVTGFDIDTKKVTDLEAGRSYIFRIPAAEIQSARKQGFSATTDFSHLSEQDAIIMCVPTPLTEHREPDLSYVANTAKAAAPWLQEGQLVVLESTTYPGHRRVDDSNPRRGKQEGAEGAGSGDAGGAGGVLCRVLAGARGPWQYNGGAPQHTEGRWRP